MESCLVEFKREKKEMGGRMRDAQSAVIWEQGGEEVFRTSIFSIAGFRHIYFQSPPLNVPIPPLIPSILTASPSSPPHHTPHFCDCSFFPLSFLSCHYFLSTFQYNRPLSVPMNNHERTVHGLLINSYSLPDLTSQSLFY